MTINGTSDLSRAPLEDLVKATNDSSNTKLSADARYELAKRQMQFIQVGNTVGKVARQMRASTGAERQRIIKAAKAADLASTPIEDLVQMAVRGSNSERNAALQELGLRSLSGTAAAAPPTPAPAPAAPKAAEPAAAPAADPVAKSAAQKRAYSAFLKGAERIAATHEATGSVPAGMIAELRVLKSRAGL